MSIALVLNSFPRPLLSTSSPFPIITVRFSKTTGGNITHKRNTPSSSLAKGIVDGIKVDSVNAPTGPTEKSPLSSPNRRRVVSFAKWVVNAIKLVSLFDVEFAIKLVRSKSVKVRVVVSFLETLKIAMVGDKKFA